MTLSPANATSNDSWWSRPSGGRDVLRVAAPMVVSSLSWTIMTFVDRMFLNWVSPTLMAGAFSAGVSWFMLICLPLGVCSYANTFVAQHDGARQHEQIGRVVWQAIWISLGFTPIVLAAVPLAPWLFGLADHTAGMYAAEVKYFQILCACAPAMLIAQAGASFYSGRGQTWVVMIVDTAAAALNLLLDYLWIFGYGGFPEWGLAGAAWATVVATWVKAAVYVALPLQARHRARYGTLIGLRFDLRLMGRILYYGGPSGLQMLLDVTGFTVFILLIGRLGEVQSEATSIAFSISSLAFMPIYGLHLAVSVLVGERLGENRDDLAARATYTTMQISWMYMLAISLLYVLTPGLFLRGFFPDGVTGSAQQAAVYALSAVLLRFVATYNLLDATQMVFVGAIKGAGDTQFVLWVSLALAAMLAGFSWLSVEVWRLSVIGCWTLVVLWCLVAAAAYAVRFWQGKWRYMRVIEHAGSDSPILLPAAAAE
ncbi:MAG TPA: MATE family efflux transporter [Lacipirellulaceae bacterium]|nr:MATE family efflux transporter [Lacipirellulaceae bacterium]